MHRPDNGLDAQVMHGLPCMAGLWPVGHNGQFGRDRACNGRVGIMREYGMVEKVGSGDMTKRGLANWAYPLPQEDHDRHA